MVCFTYTCHKNQPNVGKYTIHGSYGFLWHVICLSKLGWLKEILKSGIHCSRQSFPMFEQSKGVLQFESSGRATL